MTLSEINVYPVKSTGRISLGQSEVLPRGLPWDRRWMLIDNDNRFITARQYPALARVRTTVGASTLTVTAPGSEALELPLRPSSQNRTPVSVWRDRCEAVLVGSVADVWFSAYLELPCRLVQMTDDLVRDVNPEYGQVGDEVSFADGFPMLLIGQASLQDLNSRLHRPVDMRRFRPNLVVEGSAPYAEDGWKRIRVGDVEFDGVKNCSRCVFTTVDPDTGVADPRQEPLRTLGSYRRRPAGGVYFGQNLIPRGRGMIRVGDEVEVLESDQTR
jgi:uncharacterized protein YcbX